MKDQKTGIRKDKKLAKEERKKTGKKQKAKKKRKRLATRLLRNLFLLRPLWRFASLSTAASCSCILHFPHFGHTLKIHQSEYSKKSSNLQPSISSSSKCHFPSPLSNGNLDKVPSCNNGLISCVEVLSTLSSSAPSAFSSLKVFLKMSVLSDLAICRAQGC